MMKKCRIISFVILAALMAVCLLGCSWNESDDGVFQKISGWFDKERDTDVAEEETEPPEDRAENKKPTAVPEPTEDIDQMGVIQKDDRITVTGVISVSEEPSARYALVLDKAISISMFDPLPKQFRGQILYIYEDPDFTPAYDYRELLGERCLVTARVKIASNDILYLLDLKIESDRMDSPEETKGDSNEDWTEEPPSEKNNEGVSGTVLQQLAGHWAYYQYEDTRVLFSQIYLNPDGTAETSQGYENSDVAVNFTGTWSAVSVDEDTYHVYLTGEAGYFELGEGPVMESYQAVLSVVLQGDAIWVEAVNSSAECYWVDQCWHLRELDQDISVEDEVVSIRTIVNEIADQQTLGNYTETQLRQGVEAYYDADGQLRKVVVYRGTDGIGDDSGTFSRTYYFDNNTLIFAFYEARDAESHRLYFYHGALMRWRYTSSGYGYVENHDLEASEEYFHWEFTALTEADSF